MRCFAPLSLVLLLSGIFFCSAGQTTEIPFLFSDGFITITARAPGTGAPLTLLVDSGASASVLSMRAARKLRVPLGAREQIYGVGSRAAAFRVDDFQPSVDSMVLPPMALAADLSMADAICSRPIDGLVGVEFFRDRIVQIDYEHSCLRIREAAPLGAPLARLPIEIRNGAICVPVSVNGSRPRLTRLDTGCNDALHWVVPRSRVRPQQRRVSIGFATDPRNSMLTDVNLAGYELNRMVSSIHSEPLFPGEAGLLGNATLSRFSVTIDWSVGEVLLHERGR